MHRWQSPSGRDVLRPLKFKKLKSWQLGWSRGGNKETPVATLPPHNLYKSAGAAAMHRRRLKESQGRCSEDAHGGEPSHRHQSSVLEPGGSLRCARNHHNQKMTWFHIHFFPLLLLAKDTTLIWHCLVLTFKTSVCRDEQILFYLISE